MDVDFFLIRCTEPPRLTATEIVLNVPTRLAAEGLKRCTNELACLAQQLNRESVVIHWNDDGGLPYRIYHWQARSLDRCERLVEIVEQLKGSQSANKVSNVVSYLLSETMSSLPKESEALPSQSAGDIPQQEPTADARLVIPELSLDFNGIYYNEHPIFFFDFEDGDIIFANLAAVRAQNKKLKKLLGSNAASLNFPEELERRTLRVWQGEQLQEYENEAMRWFWDQELNIYRRKRMKFTSNAGRINFAGTDCWYSHTVNAEDTGRFVD